MSPSPCYVTTPLTQCSAPSEPRAMPNTRQHQTPYSPSSPHSYQQYLPTTPQSLVASPTSPYSGVQGGPYGSPVRYGRSPPESGHNVSRHPSLTSRMGSLDLGSSPQRYMHPNMRPGSSSSTAFSNGMPTPQTTTTRGNLPNDELLYKGNSCGPIDIDTH
jgi:hypothetical protein